MDLYHLPCNGSFLRLARISLGATMGSAGQGKGGNGGEVYLQCMVGAIVYNI